MSSGEAVCTRGRIWFEVLLGKGAKRPASVPSVLVADTTLQKERVRLLAVVSDPQNRFPCARQGQVGLEEGWNLAKQIRDAIRADANVEKRAIIAIVDVPSQAYGRREELLGIFLAAAAATDAYISARLAGHPVISLLVGRAISGGFLTHGAQANRLLAFRDPGVTIHAMQKKAAALVTRRSIEELDEMARKVIPMSYEVKDYARLGLLHKLIDGVDPDAPDPAQVARVQADLLEAITDARSGQRDLGNRFQSAGARTNRNATLEVRRRLAEQWNLK
ncbi:MAG: biotin-independent malonate decarboxylase subunit gamma [Verrucomicrobia bacterium]|nr:biotin-independent malonate decarboxylase subunit gamma [Verrucomicrobiota bacterium]